MRERTSELVGDGLRRYGCIPSIATKQSKAKVDNEWWSVSKPLELYISSTHIACNSVVFPSNLSVISLPPTSYASQWSGWPISPMKWAKGSNKFRK